MDSASLRRYSRHLLMPEVGLQGQERLQAARVLCVGVGGLASPLLLYLAAAGIGRLGLVDDDRVELSNLQRQTLFTTSDIGRRKVEAARERLLALNPTISIDAYPVRLMAENARDLVRPYDCVVDGSDLFSTRYLVNDACILEHKPNVFAAIFRFQAQVTVFAATGQPCYRCLYPSPPPAQTVPSCAEGGVLGAIAGLAGLWQATETCKLLLGIGDSLQGRLLCLDALAATHRDLTILPDPDCVLCGAGATRRQVLDDIPERPEDGFVSASEMQVRPADFFATLASGVRLLDVREPHEAVLGLYPDSLHIPLSQLDARLSELDLQTTYLVACRLGQRSRLACERLHAAGLRRVLHLQGGLLAVAALEEQLALF